MSDDIRELKYYVCDYCGGNCSIAGGATFNDYDEIVCIDCKGNSSADESYVDESNYDPYAGCDFIDYSEMDCL